jgi:hypothetical protein
MTSLPELEPQGIYRIQLCNGEQRRWQYLRTDALTRIIWRDMEAGTEFSETSLIFAWEIIGRDSP